MADQNVTAVVNQLIKTVEGLIPEYMQDPDDRRISNGSVAICIVDNDGNVYGKMFGIDKPRMRQCYKIAWIKASQVWLTGVRTGEYERLVFTNQIPENANGIDNPDLIGWEGGQPLTLSGGEKIAIGFSGFRGTSDVEIVVKALKKMQL